LLRAIFDGAMDAVLLADDQGNCVNANPAAGELFGAPARQLIGRNACDFSEATPSHVAAAWQRFLKVGLMRGRLPIIRADGSRRDIDFSARANILPGLHLSILRDITDSERAAAALRESGYFLEEAQTVAHIGSWVSSFNMPGSLYWSNECYRIFGVPEGSAIDVKSFFDRVHPDDRATVEKAVEAAIARDARYELEHRIVRPDGTVRWVYERAVIERDRDRKPVRLMGVVQDITSRRRAEGELRASEQRHRRIVETTSEGVFMIGADTRTTYVNQRMAEMLGCSVDDVLGRSICEFLDGGQKSLLEQHLKEQRPGLSGQFELQLKRGGREASWASLNVNALLDQAGRYEGALGMATDISERKRADELRGRLVAIVESSDDAIVSEDLQGVLTGWSKGAQRLFGYTADEAIGQAGSMLTPRDRAHESIEVIGRIRRGESMHHFETVRLRKDGTSVDVSLTISPIKDPNGQIIGSSAIKRDLTERRKSERMLRQVEDQLRQAQKMEAIGLLAGGVAHDFNNILSVILSYASLIFDATSPGDPRREDISEVRRAAERAADLTRQLLAFRCCSLRS
jgi:PAS domain S-box-containing protein